MRNDYDEAIPLMQKIAEAFNNVAIKLNQFSILKKIAHVFSDFNDFFTAYKNFDDLTNKEIEELLSIEFIAEDIKEFSNQVFIKKTSDDIFIYEKLFLQDLEQLEVNIQNADRLIEDSEDDTELDFF